MPSTASFRHFSDVLYCSGAEERLCATPHSTIRTHPGECNWWTSAHKAIAPEDMVEAQRSRWSRDTWDAVAAGAVSAESFRRFDRAGALTCLRNQHILIMGESTTRDLFYEFASHIGLKPPPGACMNTAKGPICTRVLNGTDATRISFQFLSSASTTREEDITRGLLSERPADAVFVYCFMYDWYGTVSSPPGSDAMGNACMHNIDNAILQTHPRTPIYLLGPTYPPNWVSPYDLALWTLCCLALWTLSCLALWTLLPRP